MKKDVCLVCMPYASIERPSIAIGLLETYLENAGISTHSIFGNLQYAELIGPVGYQSIELSYNEDLLGEWTFAGAAFPEFQPDHEVYFGYFPQSNTVFKKGMWTLRNKADDFVDGIVEQILAVNPRVVGCTSNFQQNCASLAVLRRIKALRPEIVTLMGGANCESEMGVTLVESFRWLDFVVSGEADGLLVDFVNLLLEKGTALSDKELPYGVIRAEGEKEFSPADFLKKPPRAIVEDMSIVGQPTYDSYFNALTNSTLKEYIRPGLLVETARGCWWGAKHHCTFCGLNGNGMDYRSKPPENVLKEFDNLSNRYGLRSFEVVDNILDMSYINSLMGIFAQKSPPYSIFYETKANLRREHVKKLSEAGVSWIQPGFESLIDEFLKMIDKGTTALQNLLTLKWCREFGIRVSWNMLCGAPGESQEWYHELAEWMPKLSHLQPPQGIIKMRYDRFSPYHERAEDFGIELTPYQSYYAVYPLPKEKIAQLAYFFQDKRDVRKDKVLRRTLSYNKEGYNKVHHAIVDWSKQFWGTGMPPILCMTDHETHISILDSRAVATKRAHKLKGMTADIYRICNKSATQKAIIKQLSTIYKKEIGWDKIEPLIQQLEEDALLIFLSGKYFALAVSGAIPRLSDSSDFPGGHVNVTRRNLVVPKYKEVWTGSF